MATLSLTITIPDSDFDKSLNFLNGNPDIIEQVKRDYFPQETAIAIDISQIRDAGTRFFHTNGVVASIINLTNAVKTTAE